MVFPLLSNEQHNKTLVTRGMEGLENLPDLARSICRYVSGISVVRTLEEFARDFPGGWRVFMGNFSTKMRRFGSKKLRRADTQTPTH